MTRYLATLLLTVACTVPDAPNTIGLAAPPPRTPLRHLPTGTTFAGIQLATDGLHAAWQPGCELLPTVDCEGTTARDDGATLETWTTEPEGSHHRFLLRDPPRKPLALRLPVHGAKLTQLAPDTIALTRHDRTFHYSGLIARDAAGTALPTRMEATDDAIVLHVDATGSVGAIDVDPVLTEPDLRHQGTIRYGYFGSWVSAAGDNNQDGYDDIVSDGNGNAYWLPGGPDGTTYSADGFLRHEDATFQGYSAVGGYDVNGDGVDDVLQKVNQLGNQLAFGVPGGVPENQPLRLRAYPSVVLLGDFNGDGIGDLVEGAGNGPMRTLTITRGAPDVQSRPADLVLRNLFPAGPSCVSWSWGLSAGDVNGDGYDDLLVNYYDGVAEGRGSADALLFLGSSAGLAASPAWTWLPQDPSDRMGDVRTVRFAGDLDGDGLDDLVAAGDTRVWWLPGSDLTGEPRVVGAGQGWLEGTSRCTAVFSIDPTYEDYAVFGAGVGDLNGDGYDDMAITAAGGAKVFLGGPHGPLRSPYWEIGYSHPTAAHYTNFVGDLNGDGFDDLPIFTRATWTDGPTQGGSLDLYWGQHFPDLDNDGTPNELDCDPYRDDIGPNLPEIPGTDDDNDCDGEILCYVDLDNDGVPGSLEARPLGASCTEPGYFPEGGDCDDLDPTLSPNLPELPDNERDEDCDGQLACHVDRDGDGFGALEQLPSCAADPDWTLNDQDCDDARPGVSPAATEVPGSGFDDDCDGIAACFQDLDGDFAGIPGTLVWSTDASCEHPGMGYLVDCDEGDPAVSPHLPELPGDDIDQDCDGQLACYEDLDGDGFGTSALVVGPYAVCASPGVSNFATDCAPADPTVFPTAVDLPANGIDEDCTGIDAGWADADRDGFAPVGAVVRETTMTYLSPATSADCDDTEDHIYPGAVELVTNDVDEDCNGLLTCWRDADGDGYGGCRGDSVVSERLVYVLEADECNQYYRAVEIPLHRRCGDVPGTSTRARDCDDDDPRRNPDTIGDRPDNRVDEDCSGSLLGYRDLDGDGYGTADNVYWYSGGLYAFPADYRPDYCADASCNFALRGGDCDDTNPSIHPDRAETPGDPIDDNCNATTTPTLQLLEGPGRRVRLVATDFPPNQALRLDISQTAPTSTTCPPAGPCALLSNATSLTGQANPDGELTLTYVLPSTLQYGAAYWFHALTGTPGVATQVVAWTDRPTLSVLSLGDRYIQLEAAGLPPNTPLLLDRTTSLLAELPCTPTAPCRAIPSLLAVAGTSDVQGRYRWTFRVPYHFNPFTKLRFQVVAGVGPQNATNVALHEVPYLWE
jgi:hypothetical protein